ncbi:4'-phosphopantetheinyl transferase family protein [Hyphomicrobium sp. 2TAF46]|uniref:4'-phosphopantetheinyl transferase family protein n=1 Tax=Hyphomicrobium sp. 2TAF46 TaxID=3233019 RepID=UPI003F93C0A9
MQAGHKEQGAAATVGDFEVFFVDLVKSASLLEAEEKATPRLSASDIARVASMSGDSEGRRLWRNARIATRVVLERAGGSGIRQADFEIEPGGRPRLAAGSPWFNVSHTGGAALIAVSKNTPVGVDLERKQRSLKMSGERRQRIIASAQRFGADRQLSAIHDADVMTAWVRLEAAAKALGIGIGRLLTEQGVVGGKGRNQPQDTGYGLAVRNLEAGDEYVAAIAAERLPEKLEVLPFPANDLAGFIPRRS